MELGSIEVFFILLGGSTIIGIVAVRGGGGGGVVFTPLMMGFTSIDSFIIRATGLLVAMAGSLVSARPFLMRGLANMRLLLMAAVPYSIFGVIGALLAGYVKETAGDTGEAIIRLTLGILVIGIAALILFGGKRLEYPEVRNVDGITERLALATSYYEQSLDKVVSYRVARAPVGILLLCFVGLVSGLFGLGAGWAMVPVFNLVMLAPLKVAAASSKVLIGIGDTAAIWPYVMDGGIFVLFAVPCVIGLVIGTIIGTKIMLRVKAGFVRWLIIAIMFGSGVKLVVDGIDRLS
ncbi:MAG: sulfite exporter TauE/SafE family protein [Dehalococcoidia bacterium]